ncbi:MAG: hypothetical protein L6R40_005432 [Gallowayella cf. fulva]|nr:MAG: hypothetical protein L6R40_005432 [Xanthomendoza cf. fulva]
MSIAPAGWEHIKITSSLLSIAIFTVILRFIARRRARLAIGADDWTLLLATLLVLCYVSCWLTYAVTFVMTKISILLLYNRVFPVYAFRVTCQLVGCLVIGMGSSILMIGFFQCRPFNYIWNKNIPGGICLPIAPVFYGTGIPTLLLNLIVVCLPFPIIWGLHMSWKHKLILMATFSTGGLSPILTIQTPTDAIVPAAMLIIVEPCVAIISVCLPTMGPALQDIASYSTIEYLKMICRIKTAVAPNRPPSVERAAAHSSFGSREPGVAGLGLASREDPLDAILLMIERSPECSSLEDMPMKPAMARGRWVSI